jgi:UTP--glucose-1-phosphate uridylyltransferase
MGRYILPAHIFEYLASDLKDPNRTGEVQLTTALATLAASHDVRALRLEGTRYDCGHCVGWLEAGIAYALDRPDMHQAVRTMLKKWSSL